MSQNTVHVQKMVKGIVSFPGHILRLDKQNMVGLQDYVLS